MRNDSMQKLRKQRRLNRRQRLLCGLRSGFRFRHLAVEPLEARLLLDGAPTLIGTAPLPDDGGSVTDLIERIVIQTSEDLAASGVNDPASWELRGAGPDHAFATADDVVYDLSVSPAYAAGTSFTLQIDAGTLPTDSYRFTGFSSSLSDLTGNSLDGDGDGTPGDDFVRYFPVANSTGLVLEQEDNGTYTYATELDVVEDPAGSEYNVGYALGTIGAADDVDYWWFDAQAGDRITVAVDTPDSDLDPFVELRDVADALASSDVDGGPGKDASVNHTVVDAGRYFVRVDSYVHVGVSGSTGNYELRVDVTRGETQLESDTDYANDSIGLADPLRKSLIGQDAAATVAGTIMATAPAGWPDHGNTDEDFFALGELNVGNGVDLDLRLPSRSELDGRVTLIDATGTVVADDDGDLSDADFQATIASAGSYYALVEASAGAGHRGQYLLDVAIDDDVVPRVVQVENLADEGQTVTLLHGEFSVVFDEDLDPVTVLSEGAIDLRAAGPDSLFETADDVVYNLAVSPEYSRSSVVELNIADGKLIDGPYRLSVGGTITDVAGNALDGNGDGTGGDAFTRQFGVDLPNGLGAVFEDEPNDVAASATALSVVESTTFAGFFSAIGLGAVDPGSDNDCWSFEAQTGDRVLACASTATSDLNTKVILVDGSENVLASDEQGGAGDDDSISHVEIPSDGSYYACILPADSPSSGAYELYLHQVRDAQAETDTGYGNDEIGQANPLLLEPAAGHLMASVAGIVMPEEGGDGDQDTFALGDQDTGNVVELNVRLPSSSTLAPQIRLYDSTGAAIPDEDGDPTDGHFLATLASDDLYYAQLQNNGAAGGGKGPGPLATYTLDVDITDTIPPRISGVTRLPDGGTVNEWVATFEVEVSEPLDAHVYDMTSYSFATHNGHTYVFSAESMEYADAQALAESLGGHLVTIGNQTEQDWIAQRAAELGDAWLGLRRPITATTVDGSLTEDDPPLPANSVYHYEDFALSDMVAAQPGDLLLIEASSDFRERVDLIDAQTGDLLGRDKFPHTRFSFIAAAGVDYTLRVTSDGGWPNYHTGNFSITAAIYEPHVWDNGEATDYSSWATDEPNEAVESAYISADDGVWYDAALYDTEPSDGYQYDGRYITIVEIDNQIDTDTDGWPDAADPFPNDDQNGFDVREAGADAVFGTSDDDVYRLRMGYDGHARINIIVDDGPLGPGEYQLRGFSALSDRAGNSLDGNGDGTAGDDFTRSFAVASPATGFQFEGRDNDLAETATPLTLVQDAQHDVFYTADLYGSGSIDPSGDSDYWQFDAQAGDRVLVYTKAESDGADTITTLTGPMGNELTSDADSGAGDDDLVGNYEIPDDGVYFVRVAGNSNSPRGDYELYVHMARSAQMETDQEYGNDVLDDADALALMQNGNRRQAWVSGLVMGPQWEGTVDKDVYRLGMLNAGNSVELNVDAPSGSTLAPQVLLRDSGGNIVADEDGDPWDGHFQAGITSDDVYFAELTSYWVYGGHRYLTRGKTSWPDAESYALSRGGYLVSINDAEEHAWLASTFGFLGTFHIGLSQGNDDWTTWTDGTAASFTNWHDTEPNSSGHDYAYQDPVDGQWYDTEADHRVVIEIPDAGGFADGSGPGPLATYVLEVDIVDPIRRE